LTLSSPTPSFPFFLLFFPYFLENPIFWACGKGKPEKQKEGEEGGKKRGKKEEKRGGRRREKESRHMASRHQCSTHV